MFIYSSFVFLLYSYIKTNENISESLHILHICPPEMMAPCLRVWSWWTRAWDSRSLWIFNTLVFTIAPSFISTLQQCCGSMSLLNLYNKVGETLLWPSLSSDYEILMWTLLSICFPSVPPTIRVDLRTEDGRRVIECSADDAVPAANMSWLLPEGVSEDFWFNSTSHNGSHSVRGFVLLPPCLPWELTAECVINHPAFEKPENRSITLPLCGMFNKSTNQP